MTLKDISKATGYSLTSIHRAIYNKEGLSPKTREKILKAVESMGYEVNYIASSLKRKTMNIAFVGKKPRISNDYHYMIAEGVKSAFAQDVGMNITLREYYFDGFLTDLEDEECKILSEIYMHDDLDGVVIMPINTGIKLQIAIQKLISKGFPVVLVDDSFEQMDFLCAVEPFNDLIGKTAAEFMSQICRPGKVLVALGNPSSNGQMENYESFLGYLKEYNVPITCISVQDSYDKEKLVERLVTLIDDEVVGLYTVCESNTPAICKAALASGREGLKVLGCDLSPDNKTYLEKGVLSGILDMNSYLQGFLAMRVLLEYILKNIPPKASVLSVPVRLVLRSSLEFFKGEYSAGISIVTRPHALP